MSKLKCLTHDSIERARARFVQFPSFWVINSGGIQMITNSGMSLDQTRQFWAPTSPRIHLEGEGTGHLSSEPVRNVVGMYFLPAFRQAWCFCQNHTKSVKFISVDCQHFCVNSPNFSGLKKSRPSPYGISGLKKSHYGIYGWREVHKTFYGQVYGKANVFMEKRTFKGVYVRSW